MKRHLKIATRGSTLARTQTLWVAQLIERRTGCDPIASEIITTAGDLASQGSLAAIGGKGLFVKELEEALLSGRCDMAVHSAKDVPAELPKGLTLAATPPREHAADVLISRNGVTLDDLPAGATVGTSSLRRQSQLLAARPDLRIKPVRGNIDTRLRRLAEGGFDAIVLAAAGLVRTGLLPGDVCYLPVDKFVPAAGQGTLVIEMRAQDGVVAELLAKIQDGDAWSALQLERAVVGRLGAACTSPLGVHVARVQTGAGPSGTWRMHVYAGAPDGEKTVRYVHHWSDGTAMDDILTCVNSDLVAMGIEQFIGIVPS